MRKASNLRNPKIVDKLIEKLPPLRSKTTEARDDMEIFFYPADFTTYRAAKAILTADLSSAGTQNDVPMFCT